MWFWKYQWVLQYGRGIFGILHVDSHFTHCLPCDPDCVASRSFVNRPRSASMTVDSMSRKFVSCSVSRLGGTAEWWVEYARWRFVDKFDQLDFAFKLWNNFKNLFPKTWQIRDSGFMPLFPNRTLIEHPGTYHLQFAASWCSTWRSLTGTPLQEVLRLCCENAREQQTGNLHHCCSWGIVWSWFSFFKSVYSALFHIVSIFCFGKCGHGSAGTVLMWPLFKISQKMSSESSRSDFQQLMASCSNWEIYNIYIYIYIYIYIHNYPYMKVHFSEEAIQIVELE